MNKNVVMQVLPALEMGGVERGTIEMATAMKKEGIANIVVSNGGILVKQLKKIGVPHIQMPVHSKNPLIMLLNAYRLKKVIKKYHVNLMHVRSRAPAFSVLWASRMTNIPFITTFHGVYGTKGIFKKWYNSIMTKGKKIIAVSEYVKQHIMKEYHIPEEKIKLIHRGADTDKFSISKVMPQSTEKFLDKYCISLENPVITLVGRLTRWKGQLILLEAFKYLKNKNITCLFVGSDQGRVSYLEEIKKAILELPETFRVHIISDSPEMPAVYFLSDIVVNASTDPEAFGRVIPEAQSMGKIVIGAEHGGACETIQDGKTGFLFTPSDAHDLAQKIDMILDLPEERKVIFQENSIQWVKDNFSISKMCSKTIDLYKEYFYVSEN